jgi:hypothetical protein
MYAPAGEHGATAVLLDRYPIVCRGLSRLLYSEFSIQVVDAGCDLPSCVAHISAARPTLAVIDRDLLGENVSGFVRRVRRLSPDDGVAPQFICKQPSGMTPVLVSTRWPPAGQARHAGPPVFPDRRA